MGIIAAPASDLKAKKVAFYADLNTKPEIPAPNFDTIPEELRREDRWALWRLIERDGKWVKKPYRANGFGAKANDPSTWTSFESVRCAYLRRGFEGVGFMLGDGFVGVDLDGVRDPETEKFTSATNALGRRFATYVEVSPSGTGVKLIGRGTWTSRWSRKPMPGGGEIEVYDDKRFFVITGNRVGKYGVASIQEALDELLRQHPNPSQVPPPEPPRPTHLHETDDEQVAQAVAAGGKFARLWGGDTAGYGSRSEADLALCGLLARLLGPDTARLDTQFRKSDLMRSKWDEPRGERTYGASTIAKALEARPTAPGTNEGDERPEIAIGPNEHAVNDQVAAALGRAADVFAHGGILVRVLNAGRGDRSRNAPPTIRELAPATLRELLTQHARLCRATEQGMRPVHPPMWCVNALLARGRWPEIRRLEALLPHPVLSADGSLLGTNGYDPASGLLVCVPDDLNLTAPDAPTAEDVAKARVLLLDAVQDFPFQSHAHKASWVAALLTPLAWFGFDGPAPLFLIDKNVRGAGAGLLADVAALILTGRRFPVMSYTPDREELRKRITSLAMEGARLVLLDNLTGAVGNDVLDAALTGDRWKDRVLGGNKNYDGPLHVTWFGTGNNVQLKADTARRVCHIRMETQDERPELRTNFKYPALRKHVLENRGALLSAALTILRGWVTANRPTHALPRGARSRAGRAWYARPWCSPGCPTRGRPASSCKPRPTETPRR